MFKSLGEWIQLATWDVKGFFGNADAKAHAASLREVNSQATPQDREIYQTVMSQKVEFGGIAGTIRALVKSAGEGLGSLFKMLGFVLKFFPLIAIVFLLLYLIFYVKIFSKAVPK